MKVKDRFVSTNPNLNPLQIGAEPQEWIKTVAAVSVTGELTVTAQFAGLRADGEVDVFSATKTIGINAQSYDNTITRIPSREGNCVGGDSVMSNRDRVLQRLQSDSKVERVYYYQSGGTDYFVVATYNDDPETTFYFAELYWELFDVDPDYSFEILPLASSYVSMNLPDGAVEC